VIHDFAHLIGDQAHLDYLYALTVSDVRGTNPKLWNNWKSSLFAEFYERTKRALRRGLENPIDKDELIAETQTSANEMLRQQGFDPGRIESIWRHFTETYFIRHTPDEVAWHTRVLARREEADSSPLVSVEQQTGRGGTAILTYTPHNQHSFAHTTALLDQLGLNIVDARIMPTVDGYSVDTYHVLEDDGREFTDTRRIRELETQLTRTLSSADDEALKVTRRAPRQVRMFSTTTQINFNEDKVNRRTALELIAGDRPGLLCEVGKVFMNEHVAIHNAKIMTVGERAEDVFFVTDEAGALLSEGARKRLEEKLIAALDQRS
jgi:[protein-PII] uridylyltransferase